MSRKKAKTRKQSKNSVKTVSFSTINSRNLGNKHIISSFQISPPFKPQVVSDTDVRNFDVEFTGQSVELTPPDQDEPSEISTISEVNESFSQFSYNDGSGSVLTTSSLHSRNSIPLATDL